MQNDKQQPDKKYHVVIIQYSKLITENKLLCLVHSTKRNRTKEVRIFPYSVFLHFFFIFPESRVESTEG